MKFQNSTAKKSRTRVKGLRTCECNPRLAGSHEVGVGVGVVGDDVM